MKSAGKPESPAPSPKSAADGAMTDELRAIDTAPLDRLLDIRKEESRLEEYRQRAAEMKGKVKEPVWRRVIDDYTTRVAALEEQATPLRAQVRTEYQKLRVLLDRANALRESAEMEKAEFEFRQAVGELTDRQLEERLRGPAKTLEQCGADLSAIDEQRSRFLSAFASEEELHVPTPPSRSPAASPSPPAPPPAPAPAPAAIPAPRQGAAKDLPKDLPASPDKPSAVTPEPMNAEPDATGIVSAEELAALQESPREPDAKPEEGADERTFMLPLAGLVITDGGPTTREFRLATMNYIGRSEESQIVIAKPGVSRKHALIIASADGFTIRDLGSQNGTFVNSKRISDHVLKNGDQIVIADTKLTFRTPWPPGPGAKG